MSGWIPVPEKPICKKCKGNGAYWWIEPEMMAVNELPIDPTPPPTARVKRTCDNCLGKGYTN